MSTAQDNLETSLAENRLVLEHPSSLELLERIERIAPSDATVLVTGETGTGKELVARQLHASSRRANKAFVAVNAGALPEQLIESELFGHERGAFTGAHERKTGWFETADGGTLFLDEIGDLPLTLQVKLLRVLSTGEVTRVGSRKPTPVDVRLITATNVDLLAAIGERRFREDLFYRLSVTTLALPPLRQRSGDILPIARHFLIQYGARLGLSGLLLEPDAEAALLRHDWPGNVRELENTMHRAVIECRGEPITERELGLPAPVQPERHAIELSSHAPAAPELVTRVPAAFMLRTPVAASRIQSWRDPRDAETAWASLERAIDDLLPHGVPELHSRVEALLLSAAFRHADRNQLETARLLGLSRHVVRARLLQHGQLPHSPRNALTAQHSEQHRVVRIGYQHLGMLMMVRAHGVFDKMLEQRNITVSWQEYAGGVQIVDALRRGELDLGDVGDSPAVYAQAEAVPVVYVAAEPPAPRRVALIVPRDSSVRAVRDLRGKRVVVNRVAQAHYLLMLALEEAGLELEDIDLRFAAPAGALAAFRAGTVDAWAIWDPWLSSARLDLGARVLRDASGLFDSAVYYLAHERFVRTDADLITELLTHLQIAARWVESDPVRVANLVAPLFGFSARAIEAALDERTPCSIGVTPSQIAAQQRIADQCLRLRLIPRPVKIASAQWQHRLVG